MTSVGGIGVTQLGARVPGNGPRDLVDVALFGYELPPRGVPAPPAAGEAYADSILRDEGVQQGDTLQLGPARHARAGRRLRRRRELLRRRHRCGRRPRPGATCRTPTGPASSVGPGVFQALVVRTDRRPVVGRAPRSTARPAARPRPSPRTEAADSIGGVRQQRSVFNQIIGVTLVIAIVVVALFFALLTVERIGLYGMLKAIGARSRTLFGGVVLQAVVVALIAAAIGSGVRGRCSTVRLPPGTHPVPAAPEPRDRQQRRAGARRGRRAAPSRSGACCASILRPRSGGRHERTRDRTGACAAGRRCARCTPPATKR